MCVLQQLLRKAACLVLQVVKSERDFAHRLEVLQDGQQGLADHGDLSHDVQIKAVVRGQRRELVRRRLLRLVL